MWMDLAVDVSVRFLGVWRILLVGQLRPMLLHPLLVWARKIGIYGRSDTRAIGRFLDIIIAMCRA